MHRRSGGRQNKDDSDNLLVILKAQIIQDGIRWNEKYKSREGDRRDPDVERRAERERRVEDARWHDQIMKMMMMMITKGSNSSDSVYWFSLKIQKFSKFD